MIAVFEGQKIKTENINFLFIEIKRKTTTFLSKTPFFTVPTENTSSSESYPDLMIVNYYDLVPVKRAGILEYDEFEDTFPCSNPVCIKTVTYQVYKPVEYQEFYKNGNKYVLVNIKDKEFIKNYEISIENGVLIKEGVFYKVFGNGRYIFRTEEILYISP